MNDALNSQRHTQAAWWNRILIAAKWLMVVIVIYCNGLIGYGTQYATTGVTLCLFLPLALFTSFFCSVYIDSQNGGVIGVCPQNLIALAPSLAAHSFGGTKPACGFLAG